MSETFILCALLAIVGGFIDAYTYIARGGVFAFAQTGNLIFFGINLSEGNLKEVIYYAIPICTFIVGIMLAELIRSKSKGFTRIHWRQIVIGIEIIILCIVAFIPVGDWNVVANVLITFICALQVESFKKVNGNSFASTMCTGNLRSGTEYLYHYINTKDKAMLLRSLNYFGIISCFVIGVILGTTITKIMHQSSVLFCLILLVVSFVLMIKKDSGEQVSN